MKYINGKIIYKKDILKSLIEEKKVKGCTIIGKPSQEFLEKFLDDNHNINDLYKEYGIIDAANNNEAFNLFNTSISAYIPSWGDKYITDMCSIVIKNPTVEIVDRIEKLFIHIEEYYQVEVPPSIISKMTGMFSEPIAFSDILYLLPIGRQNDLAQLIGKSKQLISDMKKGKSKITLDVLKILTKEYPLLPWDYFIGR